MKAISHADLASTSIEYQFERERMGIEPTRRLFSRHTGFEAQGGHQSRVRSRRADKLLVRTPIRQQAESFSPHKLRLVRGFTWFWSRRECLGEIARGRCAIVEFVGRRCWDVPQKGGIPFQ